MKGQKENDQLHVQKSQGQRFQDQSENDTLLA